MRIFCKIAGELLKEVPGKFERTFCKNFRDNPAKILVEFLRKNLNEQLVPRIAV